MFESSNARAYASVAAAPEKRGVSLEVQAFQMPAGLIFGTGAVLAVLDPADVDLVSPVLQAIVVLSIFPIISVANRLTFTLKVSGTVIASNCLAVLIYWFQTGLSRQSTDRGFANGSPEIGFSN